MVQFTTLLKAQTVKLILLIAEIPSSTMYLHVEQISDNSRRAFKVQDFFNSCPRDLVDIIVSPNLFKKKLKQYFCLSY